MSHRTTPALLVTVLAALPMPATWAADQAQAAVSFSGEAFMPSLKDSKQKDKFAITLSDSQVVTAFNLECKAGRNALAGLVKANEECAVTGNGVIINPRNPAEKFPRTQYSGGFVVQPDGATDLSTVLVNYLPVGKVPASTGSLSGIIKLKPENPSATASALKEMVLGHLKTQAGAGESLVDARMDTVEIPDLFIPSAGFASDKGCNWRGSMAFAYQSESWFLDLSATCAGKTYVLKGNMPWVDAQGVENRTQYNLVLTLPSAEVASDEAMFADPTGDGDMFASAEGITGTITMDESQYVDTLVDGKTERLPTRTEINGTLTGQGVPLETVRSLSQIIAILARTFFGA